MFSSFVVKKMFQAVVCIVCRAVCEHKTAERITMYIYWLIPQNFNFSKAWPSLPKDGPDGPKHVGASMRYFNCTF